MTFGIRNNMYSQASYRNFTEAQSGIVNSVEKLSSGFRINEAADDSVGLAISEKLRSQITGKQMALRNVQDGISIIQTADGALDRVSVILRRMRDLSELAANGDKTDADRSHYQEEVNQLLDEIERIGKTTEYNTKKLFDGSIGTSAKLSGDIDSVVKKDSVNVAGKVQTQGEYKVEIQQSATKAKALFTSGGVNTEITDTFSTFVGGNDGTYTFRISSNDKEATVDMKALANSGDTISEVLNKIDKALSDSGIEAHAKFEKNISGTNIDGIEIESNKFGSAHDIRISIVNQPGVLYGSTLYNANDGTAGAIYNSDRSQANGTISGNTVLVGNAGNLDMKSIMSNLYDGTSITISDKSGNSGAITIDAGDTVNDIVNEINGLAGVNIQATYNESEGKFRLYSTASGTGPISIKGTNDTDTENEVAAMLGIYGEFYQNDVEGKKLSSTWDYHLKVTSPNEKSTSDVFARYGNRSTKFDAVDSFSAVTESGIDPDQTGSEIQGAGGIAGIEFQLSEKTVKGGEKFSIIAQNGELNFQIGSLKGSESRIGLSIGKISLSELGIKDLDISTQSNAKEIIDNKILDVSMEDISTLRAKLGAAQNRLGQTVTNLSISRENFSNAESRIRDTDYAKETMVFTRRQIMAQASAAILTQSNSIPKLALQLLG